MQSWINSTNGYDIVLLNGDGSNPRVLAPDAGNDTRPALSYSGAEVVFASNRDGDNEIYRVNTDGTGRLNYL